MFLIRGVKQSQKEKKQKLKLQLRVMQGPGRKVANVLLPSKPYISSLQLHIYVTTRIDTSMP
jgi:hypothetical protein